MESKIDENMYLTGCGVKFKVITAGGWGVSFNGGERGEVKGKARE